MLEALAITEEEAAGLAELAALDLAMAKDFAARAQAAEDPAVAADLARSYQRVARSYRQTLALKMRLAREMTSHAREVAGDRPAQPAQPARPGPNVRRRVEELRCAVERVVWTEFERPEDEADRDFTLDMLDEAVADAVLDPDAAARPLDEQVAELCEDLGLDPKIAARWRNLPDPPSPADQAAPTPAPCDTG